MDRTAALALENVTAFPFRTTSIVMCVSSALERSKTATGDVEIAAGAIHRQRDSGKEKNVKVACITSSEWDASMFTQRDQVSWQAMHGVLSGACQYLSFRSPRCKMSVHPAFVNDPSFDALKQSGQY